MFGEWKSLSDDIHGRPTCLWHDEGFMLVRIPLSVTDTVTQWILFRKLPFKRLGDIPGEILINPFDPPMAWADEEIMKSRYTRPGTETIPASDASYKGVEDGR